MQERDQWYYHTGEGKQVGPMDFAALREAARAGRFGVEEHVWHEGDADWTPASQVPGLFEGAPAGEAPLPPAAGGTPAGAGEATLQQRMAQQAPPWFHGYAGFWLRAIAFVVDHMLLWLVGFIVLLPFLEYDRFEEVFEWAGLILGWLYFAGFESSHLKATPGKLLLGIEVTDMTGQRLSFLRATGRYLAKLISAITLFIGYVMAGFTPRKQALHDMIADCLVVRA